MIRVLLDTHVLLWAWVSPEKLSARTLAILKDPANHRLVSSVSAFEIANKFRLGKLAVAPELVHRYSDHLLRFLAQELPITTRHAQRAGAFSMEHRDPFDRLLAAQSQLEDVPLLTKDEAFAEFPIQTIW